MRHEVAGSITHAHARMTQVYFHAYEKWNNEAVKMIKKDESLGSLRSLGSFHILAVPQDDLPDLRGEQSACPCGGHGNRRREKCTTARFCGDFHLD